MPRYQLHHRLAFLPLLAASVIVALPGAAHAQQAAAEQATTSQGEYRKAHEAAKAHNWAEARRILLGLWSKSKTYDVAASLSEAEFALGHSAASAQYMDYALRHVTPNESASTVANMKGALEKIRPKVGGVKLQLSDPSASVSVDGVVVDYDTTVEIFLDPGPHRVEAAVGERKAAKDVQTRAGETQTLEMNLPPPPSAAPAPVAPTSPEPAPPVARKADFSETGVQPRTIALIVGGALAVGGLGTGVGFGIASNSSEGDVEDYRKKVGSSGCSGGASASPDCAALKEAADSQRRSTHVANVGYGIAAVGLVTVGVALLWPRSAAPTNAQASRLELRWSGTGISLSGKF